MAQKFFSFLGTGNYQLCKYKLAEDKISNEVIFIQEALIKFLCKDFTEKDSICIFVTKEAKEKHWNELFAQITKMNLSCHVISVSIEDSKTEADIWNLFKTLYDEIERNDSVIFDLTHSFRYLPMLFFSILNYAQYLKHITVKGIFYGAWEARKQEENIAPVFNMTDSYQVLQWASAADVFTNYGIADKLYQRIKNQDLEFGATGKLSDSILKISDNMNYSRGQRILEGKMFSNCIEKIDMYKYSDGIKLNPILLPLLVSIENKIKEFNENSALNFIPAVQWYINHDMPAEAISMLKEGVITYLLEKNGFDFKKSKLRLVLGKRLAYFSRSSENFSYTDKESEYRETVEFIMKTPLAKDVKAIIESFNSFRNDIDHSGFIEHARSPENLKKEIKDAFNRIKTVFSKYNV